MRTPWYPDTQDNNTGSPGTLETDNSSDIEQESISTSQQVTPIPQSGDPGFVDTTQGNQVTSGIGKGDLDIMPCAPVLDKFKKKKITDPCGGIECPAVCNFFGSLSFGRFIFL